MVLHAISLLTHRRLIDDVERHSADAQLIVLPFPCALGVQAIDFRHAGKLIAQAKNDARAFLDSPAAHRASTLTRARHVLR